MSMNGKTIVITGGSSGIGAAAARAFREDGATVIISGRSAETARLAGEIGCDHVIADFARLRDVRELAAHLLSRYPRIDVLANNVGAIVDERQTTEDGHEKTFQVNHLAPFLLSLLLRERLEQSQAMVINTSSGAHQMGRLDLDDLENARSYSAWRAYGTAKLMNILHAAEMNRRFQHIRAFAFHPGVVATGFAREGGVFARFLYNSPLGKIFMLSSERGADTMIWLANQAPAAGLYFEKRKLARMSAQASNAESARLLWEKSEGLLTEQQRAPIA